MSMIKRYLDDVMEEVENICEEAGIIYDDTVAIEVIMNYSSNVSKVPAGERFRKYVVENWKKTYLRVFS